MASIAHWRRYLNTLLLDNPVVSQVFRPEEIEECCRQSNVSCASTGGKHASRMRGCGSCRMVYL